MKNDTVLAALIMWAEQNNINTPITISVNGLLLEGYIISEREYFEETTSRITSNWPETAEHLREILSELPHATDTIAMDRMNAEGTDREEVLEIWRRMTEFLHLRNVRVLLGGFYSEFSGRLWRGRVSAIDGYFLGRRE